MAQVKEITAIYTAAVIQGLALVTFPAASTVFTSAADYGLSSTVFTSAADYGLSSTEYGGMFVPQVVTAISSSFLGGSLTRRIGGKRIYLLGLVANLLAMALLVLSRFVILEHALAYDVLLVATGCLGAGFGFTVPALNTFTAAFFPQKVDKAVLGLNALLGLGTALAPVFVALFVGLGIWWGLPVLVGALILGLFFFSVGLAFTEGSLAVDEVMQRNRTKLPARFWIFAAFALLYGVCETMCGNWASIYMTKQFGASTAQAALALTVFWGMVTVGRIFFAIIENWFPERRTCVLLPFIVIIAFAAIAFIPKSNPVLGIAAFALAGLGCSALLPLTISFGQKQLTTMAATAAGGVIAFYQIGYGIAAFGVGPLQTWMGLELSTIYGGTTVVALALALLALIIVHNPANIGTQRSFVRN